MKFRKENRKVPEEKIVKQSELNWGEGGHPTIQVKTKENIMEKIREKIKKKKKKEEEEKDREKQKIIMKNWLNRNQKEKEEKDKSSTASDSKVKEKQLGTGTVETLARLFGETEREKASREKLEKEKRKSDMKRGNIVRKAVQFYERDGGQENLEEQIVLDQKQKKRNRLENGEKVERKDTERKKNVSTDTRCGTRSISSSRKISNLEKGIIKTNIPNI